MIIYRLFKKLCPNERLKDIKFRHKITPLASNGVIGLLSGEYGIRTHDLYAASVAL